MAHSILYKKLLNLSKMHANPSNLEEIFAIRSPNAIHAWGYKYLVSHNTKLSECILATQRYGPGN